MPAWVDQGVAAYVRRLPPHLKLELTEIALGPRGRGAPVGRAIESEAQALKRAAGDAHVVALDRSGRRWSTTDLGTRLERWLAGGRDVALLIGGPDGLAPDCLSAANERWSLGPLTFPHGLVRVIVVEQLYRAWTILSGHPYHRE